MSSLQALLALLSLALSAQPSSTDSVAISDDSQRSVVVNEPGQEPVMARESEAISARNALLGLWEVSYLEQRAESRPDLAPQLHIRFSRGRVELFQAGCAPKVVAYNLDTKDDPSRFDWYEYQGSTLKLQRGIYSIDGETLLLCLGPVNGRRATEFLTTPYDGRTLFAMRRVDGKNEFPPKK